MDNYNTVKLPLRNAPGKYALVDDDYDGEWLSGFKWRLGPTGYVQSFPLPQGSGSYRKSVYLSRMAYGESLIPKGTWVTFRNGNKLDCRTRNLVLVTPQESANARPLYVSHHSNRKYRGVTKSRWGWGDGFNIYAIAAGNYLTGPNGRIMGFPDEAAAARAYDIKAKELWGDRAILNLPDDFDPTRTIESFGTESTRAGRNPRKAPIMSSVPSPESAKPSPKLSAAEKQEIFALTEALAAYVAAAAGTELSYLDPVDLAEIKRVQTAIADLVARLATSSR